MCIAGKPQRANRFRPPLDPPRTSDVLGKAYFLRCRILARIRRFLRPIFRRPLPDFFVPTRPSGGLCVCRMLVDEWTGSSPSSPADSAPETSSLDAEPVV